MSRFEKNGTVVWAGRYIQTLDPWIRARARFHASGEAHQHGQARLSTRSREPNQTGLHVARRTDSHMRRGRRTRHYVLMSTASPTSIHPEKLVRGLSHKGEILVRNPKNVSPKFIFVDHLYPQE